MIVKNNDAMTGSMALHPWRRQPTTLDDIFLSRIDDAKRVLISMGGAFVSIYTLGAVEALNDIGAFDGSTQPDTIIGMSGSAAHTFSLYLNRNPDTLKEVWREVISSDILDLGRGRRPGRPPLDIDKLCREIFPKYLSNLNKETFERAQAKMYVGVTDIDRFEFGFLQVTSPDNLIERVHTGMLLPGLCGTIDKVGQRNLVDGFIDPLPFDRFSSPEQLDYLIVIATAPADQERELGVVERGYLRLCKLLGRGVNDIIYDALIKRNEIFAQRYEQFLDFHRRYKKTVIIQPETSLPAHPTCKDPARIEATRVQGYLDTMKKKDEILSVMKNSGMRYAV